MTPPQKPWGRGDRDAIPSPTKPTPELAVVAKELVISDRPGDTQAPWGQR